jgi:hypothetical protein
LPLLIIAVQAGMNGAMNLIAKVIRKLFRVKPFFAAHRLLQSDPRHRSCFLALTG